MDYQPAWMTDELNQALAQIGGHNQRKKRETVLRLAEASATGQTQQGVWARPECCSRTCWEGKYKEGVRQPGWRDDPAIQAALEAATRRAHWWIDQADTRRMEKRLSDVARAKDELARLSFLAAQTLGTLLGAESEESKRKAANDILDRADESTASKRQEGGGVTINLTGIDPDGDD